VRRFGSSQKTIGVGSSDAFKLEQLAGQREVVFAMCEALETSAKGDPFRFPGWRKALEMASPDVAKGRWGKTAPSVKEFVPDRAPHHIYRTGVPDSWQTEGDEWHTPQHLFDFLTQHYPFTVDVAATARNRKVKKFYDKAQDGLKQNWTNEVVFMNPPYSEAGKWCRKAAEAAKAGAIVIGFSDLRNPPPR
jgi:DNA N-6-adenine-methyltransferase (Dam)